MSDRLPRVILKSTSDWWYRWEWELADELGRIGWGFAHTEGSALRQARRAYWLRRKSWFRDRAGCPERREIEL